jgi:hypothetical protein
MMNLYVVHDILSYQPWYQHKKWFPYACVDDWFWFVSWHGWIKSLQGQLDLSQSFGLNYVFDLSFEFYIC